jgi:predicted 2-oxoglutarate/Fe(II)-dependent dioxygenase YbiX
MVVELKAGDVFMFPDSLIHHANEAVQGERHSVIAFTQQNLFHYWERKYKSCNNNDKRAVSRNTKKTLNRVKGT